MRKDTDFSFESIQETIFKKFRIFYTMKGPFVYKSTFTVLLHKFHSFRLEEQSDIAGRQIKKYKSVLMFF